MFSFDVYSTRRIPRRVRIAQLSAATAAASAALEAALVADANASVNFETCITPSPYITLLTLFSHFPNLTKNASGFDFLSSIIASNCFLSSSLFCCSFRSVRPSMECVMQDERKAEPRHKIPTRACGVKSVQKSTTPSLMETKVGLIKSTSTLTCLQDN